MDKKIKILIADDNKAIAMAFDLKLKHEGFDTKVVFNGKDAVDLLEKEKFDLLMLDLIMPVMDGFGVLNALKEKGIKMPIIVDSELSQAEDLNKVKELGVMDFFVKSDMSIAEMVEKIKAYFKV
jgi:DNA-binding response OmpR family regulator